MFFVVDVEFFEFFFKILYFDFEFVFDFFDVIMVLFSFYDYDFL